MNFNYEKNLKIVHELMSFCYNHGSKDVTVKVTYDEKICYIKVKSIVILSKDSIEHLNHSLNTPRQHEVESYYWQLGGESIDCELTLLGMMTDSVKIEYENNLLIITLCREE